jgi:O-methyltransferase
VVSFEGWALSPPGIAGVSVYCDGELLGNASYGLTREDVARHYPAIPNSDKSGYRFDWDTAEALDTVHRLRVEAKNVKGYASQLEREVETANPVTYHHRLASRLAEEQLRVFAEITGGEYDASADSNYPIDNRYDYQRNKPFSDPSGLSGDLLIATGTMVKLLSLEVGSTVLDLGCGCGWTSIFLARCGFEVTAVDTNPRSLAIGRANAQSAGVTVEFIKADMQQFMASEQFDAVVIFDALHHCLYEREVLVRAESMLRRGGKIIVCEPDYPDPNKAGLHTHEEARFDMVSYGVLEKGLGTPYLIRLLAACHFQSITVFLAPGNYRRWLMARKWDHEATATPLSIETSDFAVALSRCGEAPRQESPARVRESLARDVSVFCDEPRLDGSTALAGIAETTDRAAARTGTSELEEDLEMTSPLEQRPDHRDPPQQASTTIDDFFIRSWFEDREFCSLVEEARGATVVDERRLYVLMQVVKATATLEGPGAEFGVWKGGSAKLLSRVMSEVSPGKVLHLFDTFAGMPRMDPTKDLHREGDFGDTSLQEVRVFLKDCRNVRFHPGLFEDTMPRVAEARFSFAHVDCDVYWSVMQCCEFLYPRMVPGGIIVFDDYGQIDCPGAKRAVDEFFAPRPESPIYFPVLQALVIKLTS